VALQAERVFRLADGGHHLAEVGRVHVAGGEAEGFQGLEQGRQEGREVVDFHAVLRGLVDGSMD
jgi:hypothetical protein